MEVSSLLADQEQDAEHYTVVDTDAGGPGQQPRHTILTHRITQLAPATVTAVTSTALQVGGQQASKLVGVPVATGFLPHSASQGDR